MSINKIVLRKLINWLNKTKFYSYLMPYAEINFIWINVLNGKELCYKLMSIYVNIYSTWGLRRNWSQRKQTKKKIKTSLPEEVSLIKWKIQLLSSMSTRQRLKERKRTGSEEDQGVWSWRVLWHHRRTFEDWKSVTKVAALLCKPASRWSNAVGENFPRQW